MARKQKGDEQQEEKNHIPLNAAPFSNACARVGKVEKLNEKQ